MVEAGERLILKLAHWPEADRLAWARAVEPGDLLEGSGAAAGWPGVVQENRVAAYGRWLGFLARSGQLSPDASPGTRACRANVEAYLKALEPRCGSVSRWNYISNLATMLGVLEPEGDYAWLQRLASKLHARMRPRIDRARQVLPVDQIYAAALAQMAQALAMPEKSPLPCLGNRHLEREVTFRDRLVIAMLAACPLRRRSFSALELGRHLVRHSDRFWLHLEPRDLKNAASLTVSLPETLTPWLDRYLAEIRPRLTQGYAGPRLWVSRRGTAMTDRSLSHQVGKVTRQLLGRRLGMHLFRHCAATSLARDAPEHAREIPALLGHQGFSTGERHYNLAQGSVAVHDYQEGLLSLRLRLQNEAPCRDRNGSPGTEERRR